MKPEEAPTDVGAWEADVVLADGSTAHVRGIRPADQPRLVAFHGRLSEQSTYFRFFSPMRTLSPALAERFATVDFHDRVAFIAERGNDIIAVARYDRTPGASEAEVAFTVEDRYQGQGLGTLLLEYLTVAARQRGINSFVAEVLPQNSRMLRVFRDAGFAEEVALEAGVVRIGLSLEDTATQQALVDDRERRAEARSVSRLLAPASIAVLADWSVPGAAAAVYDHLVNGGFRGPVHRVGPGGPDGASLTGVEGPVDLAVLALAPPAVIDAISDCASSGVRALLVLSLGFADAGDAGAALERKLVSAARRNGMRVLGPGSIGAINADPDIAMNASAAARMPPFGPVALSSQSGALGLSLLREAARRGIGISSFVAVGNKADVSGNDLLQYWEADPTTAVILLYLESFGNPRKFSRVARRVGRTKPIVAVKSGRSPAGARVASARSASGRGTDRAVQALFRQAGVIRVDTVAEFFDVAQVLATVPRPAGRNTAIVGNAGGPAILAADACDSAGLSVPPLSPATIAGLAPLAPVTVDNPVTLAAEISTEGFRRALGLMLADPGVDAVLAIVAATGTRAAGIAAAVSAAAGANPTKPVIAIHLGDDVPAGPDGHLGWSVPVFDFPEPAAHALGRAATYSMWRAEPAGVVPALPDIDAASAHEVVAAAVLGADEPTALEPATVEAILVAAGVATSAGDPPVAQILMDVDPAFGPVVTFLPLSGGAGGERFRLIPLTDTDGEELVGPEPALQDAVHRLAQLVDAIPEIVHVEATLSATGGLGDVRVAAAVAPSHPLPLRRLR